MEYVGQGLNSFLRCLVGFSEGFEQMISCLEGIQCPQICRIANTPGSNSSPCRRGISGGEGQEASASFGRGHGLNLHLQGTARARDLCLLRSGMKCSSCFSRARQSASSYFNSVSLQPRAVTPFSSSFAMPTRGDELILTGLCQQTAAQVTVSSATSPTPRAYGSHQQRCRMPSPP